MRMMKVHADVDNLTPGDQLSPSCKQQQDFTDKGERIFQLLACNVFTGPLDVAIVTGRRLRETSRKEAHKRERALCAL